MPAVTGRGWVKFLLLAIVVGYVGLLILGPLTALVVGALSQGAGAALAALAQPEVAAAFWRTMWIAVLVVLVHLGFGVAVAWVMVRHEFPGKRLLNGLIDMPFAMSPVVVGYMLLLLFGRQGLLAPALEVLGVRVAFALPGMVLATLFVTLPFMVRELVPVLEAFQVEQELAAATLGARGWQVFWRVTLPALRWGLIYGVTLTFARALGEFGAVLVIGGGIQGKTETATLYIYHMLEERMYTAAYSAALVLGLISFLLVMATEVLRKAEHKRTGR